MYALSLHTTTSKALSAEPTRINSRKMSRPLELVAFNGKLNMLRSLVEEHNYDPKQKGTGGSTLLHCACGGGHLDVVKYLIDEHQLDPLSQNDVDKTPLNVACEAGRLDIVRYLVDEQYVDVKENTDTMYTRLKKH